MANSAPDLVTKEQMEERVHLLLDKMDAYYEENPAMQAEIGSRVPNFRIELVA